MLGFGGHFRSTQHMAKPGTVGAPVMPPVWEDHELTASLGSTAGPYSKTKQNHSSGNSHCLAKVETRGTGHGSVLMDVVESFGRHL